MQGKEKVTKSRRVEHMSLEGFCTFVKTGISHVLGNAAEVTVDKVLKNNGTRLYGLTIKEKGSNLAPTIYLEGFYERYLEGEDISSIEKEILFIYKSEKPAICFDTGFVKDWENVKRNVVCRVINCELNKEKLEGIPYFQFLDLAVTFSVLVETGGLPCSGSFTIHNSHIMMWGVTADELYTVALENTRRLEKPEIIRLGDALMEIVGKEVVSGEGYMPDMYIFTNKKKLHGASCLLFTDMLQELADKIGSDLFIIPSSIHEAIIVPRTEEVDSSELDGMVNIVNAEQVQPEEILSDHVYKFTRETGKVTM